MKSIELRNKTVKALKEELVALHEESFNLRTQRTIGQSTQSHLVKINRRKIARVKTILGEKEGSQV